MGTTNEVPITGRTFTCFSRLPFELRKSIWEYSCRHERNLDIWVTPLPPVFYVDEPQPFKYVTTTSPPVVLHTCHESRAAGLKHYDLSFGTTAYRVGAHLWSVYKPEQLYVNFNTDWGSLRHFCLRLRFGSLLPLPSSNSVVFFRRVPHGRLVIWLLR